MAVGMGRLPFDRWRRMAPNDNAAHRPLTRAAPMPDNLPAAFRHRWQIVLAFGLLLSTIWAGVAFQLQRTYSEESRFAESTMRFQAEAIAESTRSSIGRLNELLIDLREEWMEQPDQFAHLVQMRQAYMSELVFQVAVLDRAGYLLYSNLNANRNDNLDGAGHRRYFGNQPDFRRHQERGGDQLLISDPLVGAISGRWELQLTRPIYRGATFDGMIEVSVLPASLMQGDRSLTPLRDLDWHLARSNGQVLASEKTDRPVPTQLRGAPFNLPVMPRAGISHEIDTEGVEQLVGYAVLPESSLVLVAQTPLRDLLGNYARQQRQLLLAAAAFTALLAIPAWLLWRSRTAESAARASASITEGILSSAIDALGEGFAVYDQHDRLLYCNERYRELYALSAEKMLPGVHFEDILQYGLAHGQYPEAAGREADWLAERLAHHALPRNDEVQPLGDGRWLRIRERITPAGHRVGLRLDISDRVHAHQALELALAEAKGANRAKTTFLANISHALQTPLASVLGFANLLQRSSLDTRQADWLHQMQTSAEHLRRLVTRLLDYTALEQGNLPPNVAPFNVVSLLESAVARAAATIGERSLRLQLQVDDRLPGVLVGDGNRLIQALDELLDNAVQFCHEGQVLLTADWLETGNPAEGRLKLTVDDTGVGIASEDQERIFLPLTQLEDNSNRRHDGTGLGLALAHAIITAMGGTLTVSSAAGLGARFMISVVLLRDTPPHPVCET